MSHSPQPMAVSSACGDPALADLVRAVQRADSALAMLHATQALANSGHPDAAPHLVEVLGFNNPGAAVAAVDGLIALGQGAVEPILTGLDGHNYGARAWAVRALAGIGDVRGLEVLEEALATDIGPSVRRAAARGLGRLHLTPLPQEVRLSVSERCLVALEQGCGDGEWVVRYAVVVGLESLVPALYPEAERLQRARRALGGLGDPLAEEALVVRLRAAQALERIDGPGVTAAAGSEHTHG